MAVLNRISRVHRMLTAEIIIQKHSTMFFRGEDSLYLTHTDGSIQNSALGLLALN